MKLLVPLLVAFLSFLGLSMAYISERKEEIMDQSWYIWKSTHNKSYVDLNEEKLRYNIWTDNLRFITEYNRESSGVFLKMNHFGDLTSIEFSNLMNGYVLGNENKTGSIFLPPNHVNIPDNIDWRKEGYVTPVKNQGLCGSWPFSTVRFHEILGHPFLH